MTLKLLPLALLAVALAPAAAAEYYEGKPACPEGQMCTLSAEDGGEAPHQFGPEGCIECAGPVDGGNVSRPTEDCVDWCPRAPDAQSHAPADTCMDGADPHEVCDRDVQYLGGGNGQPEVQQAPGSSEALKGAPAVGALVGAAALAGAALLAARRR